MILEVVISCTNPQFATKQNKTELNRNYQPQSGTGVTLSFSIIGMLYQSIPVAYQIDYMKMFRKKIKPQP